MPHIIEHLIYNPYKTITPNIFVNNSGINNINGLEVNLLSEIIYLDNDQLLISLHKNNDIHEADNKDTDRGSSSSSDSAYPPSPTPSPYPIPSPIPTPEPTLSPEELKEKAIENINNVSDIDIIPTLRDISKLFNFNMNVYDNLKKYEYADLQKNFEKDLLHKRRLGFSITLFEDT